MVRVKVRVRLRTQDAPGTETPTVHLSPRRAEWSTQGRVPVRIILWVPRPDYSMGHYSGRPQKYSLVDTLALWKSHGDVSGSMPSVSAPFFEPVCVL